MSGGMTPEERQRTLGSLGAREAASMADVDISERHDAERAEARKRIKAKLEQFWPEYQFLPLFLMNAGLVEKGKLTSNGARRVREKVVELLQGAPLTLGIKPDIMFADTWDIGPSLKNCWHLNLGFGQRQRTEKYLFRYDSADATPQMRGLSSGGDKPAEPNTRPCYAALNYSRAKCGGSSRWGKTHFILKDHMRFNATFTCEDSFVVEGRAKEESYRHLGNYHNVYPIILGVAAGGTNSKGHDLDDILKSMIDYALGLKLPPDEEFGGGQYVEAQIPGDILFSRDVYKVVVNTVDVPRNSKVDKNIQTFAAKHNLLVKYI